MKGLARILKRDGEVAVAVMVVMTVVMMTRRGRMGRMGRKSTTRRMEVGMGILSPTEMVADQVALKLGTCLNM